jgi:uncharacterized membrane protein
MRAIFRIELAILFLAFFVVVPAIAAGIGYAAWLGKPKNWDRTMYWTAFTTSIMASGLLVAYAIGMRADVRTWHYLVQIALFGLSVLLFGVAGGCMVAVFTYRRGKGPVWQPVASRQGDSADNSESNHHPDKSG